MTCVKKKIGFIVLAVLSVILTAQTPALTVDFSAGVAAKLADGTSLAPVVDLANPTLRKGDAPSRTTSLLMTADEDLSYPLQTGYFNINRGTLEFRFKPVGWGNGQQPPPGSNNYIPLVAIDAGLGRNWSLLFYLSYSSPGTSGAMKTDFRSKLTKEQGYRTVYAQNAMDASLLKPDTWNHIILTWSSMDITAYINGREVGSVSYGLPVEKELHPEWKLWFLPKGFWKQKKQNSVALAGITLHDKTWTAAMARDKFALLQAATQSSNQAVAPVPLSAQNVQVDGELSPGEWDDATRFPLARMNGNGIFNSDFPAEVYLKHNGSELFVGFQAQGAAVKVSAAAGQMDRNVFAGTEFEISWRIPGAAELAYCQLALAPNGAWAFRDSQDRWRPLTFTHQTRQSADGWSVEIAIPLTEMGVTPPAALPVQFCLQRPEYLDTFNRWLSWSVVQPQAMFFRNMGELQLRDDALRVSLAWPGKLNYGEYQLAVAASLPLTYAVTLKGAGLDLQEHGESTFEGKTWQGKAPSNGLADWRVQLQENNRTIFNYESKVQVKEAVILECRCIASAQKIFCTLDLQGLATQLGTGGAEGLAGCRLQLRNPGGEVLSAWQGQLSTLVSQLEIPLPDLAEGEYILEAVVSSGNEEYRREKTFVRPSDLFLRDRKGMERELPYPYVPLRYEGKRMRALLTAYEFDDQSPFPSSVSHDGQPVLPEGVELFAVINGRSQPFRPLAQQRLEQADDQCRDSGMLESSDGTLRLQWQRTLAYDGMLRYDLTLAPVSAPVNIENLQLRALLPIGNARYALGPNFLEEWATSGAAQAFPLIWATGPNRGFCMFTDNDANWVFPLQQEPLQLHRRPDGKTEISARLVSSAVTLREPATYVLGMMATPAKPLRQDWRAIRDSGWGRLQGQNIQVIGWGGMGNHIFRRIMDFSQPDPDGIAYWQKRMAGTEAGVNRLFPYSFMNAMPDNNPIFDYYYADWERKVDGFSQPRHDYGVDSKDKASFYMCNAVCANKTDYVDYLAYYLDRYLQDFPVFAGLYTDGGSVCSTDAPYRNTSLKDVFNPKRKVRNVNLFGMRDAYERFYKIIRHRRGPEGIMFTHSWDTYLPPVVSFNDLIYPGEEFMHSIQKGLHVYIEETPLEKWQSNYNSQIYGAGVQFLTQYRKFGGDLRQHSPEVRRDYTRPCLMMCLLHDVPMSGAWYADVEGYWKLFADLAVTEADFTGYWQDNAWPASEDEKVKLSVYRWRNKTDVLLIAGNLNRTETTVRIPLNDINLDTCNARDALSGEAVDLRQPLALREFGFRIIHLTPANP